MTKLITSSISSKGQLTLPKEVRALLGIKSKGQLVGFLVDTELGSVRLARVEAVISNPDFTKEEYNKLLKLRGKKGKKGFADIQGMLKDLKK